MITDIFLNNLAKAINGESFTLPAYNAFSSSVITVDATDTSLPTEYDRSSASGARINNTVTFTSVRSGAIASSSGDYINSMGLLSSSTVGDLHVEALVPNVLHTTSFDLEVDWAITIERKG